MSLPWEGPGLPPPRPKNATNYWGSRHWSLSFNPWQVPLGYYQDVNGRDRAVWHDGDREGFRGVHLQDEQALLHQPCFDITHGWIFIKGHYHLVSKRKQIELILTPASLRATRWWIFKSKSFFFFLRPAFFKGQKTEGGAQERGRVHDTTFLPALSSRHEKMSERVPEAALVRFILICTDEPLLALTWQPSASSDAKHTEPPNERSADQ